jgi:hypothetical protein
MSSTDSASTTDSDSGLQPGLEVGSPRYYELERMSARELDKVFLRGTTPDLDSLAGWEFRGVNHPGWAHLGGIKKFVKGFFRKEDGLYGYNCPVRQNGIQAPWITKPTNYAPKRFGFYKVDAVSPTDKENKYLHAVLLNYGKGGNKAYDLSSGLRDYLVQVDPDNPDLYLGKAYYAVGPLRVSSNFFILERFRPATGAISGYSS